MRELPPAGTVTTDPSSAAVATTVSFDNIAAGTGSFSSGVASFSGGTVFAPASGESALLASGSQAYNASSNPAEVDFSQPVSSASFFYVYGFGFAAGTATAYGADGTVLGSVNSNAATTNGDPANFVTLAFAQPIARITFSGGVIDHFSFTTVANDQAEFVHVAASQTVSGINLGNQSTVASTDLVASSLTPTATGFTATFSAPLNASVLNLYDTGTMGPADATLVGQATGPVTGSLVLSNNNTTVTFIKTTGILSPDTYTITLNSSANAFVTTSGTLLDGNGDGTPGDNLTYTFTVNPLPSNAVVVSIPNFTRGYGQPVNVPASSTSGLPITLSTGENVSGVDLTLLYNPALLTLSGFTTSIPGASALFNVTKPGTAVITISSAGQFSSSAGSITLGDLTASVPNNAPYGSKEILQITKLSVFDDSATPQPLPSVAQDAIHIAAYFGDTNGDQSYSTPDVTLEQRYIGLINNGFPAFPLADPTLIGNITLSGLIQANDTTSIQREIGEQINVPNIPALPTGLTPPPTGPDPEIFIPNIQGQRGRCRHGPRRDDGHGILRHHGQRLPGRDRLRPDPVQRLECRTARLDVLVEPRFFPFALLPGTRRTGLPGRVCDGNGDDSFEHDHPPRRPEFHRGLERAQWDVGYQSVEQHFTHDDINLRRQPQPAHPVASPNQRPDRPGGRDIRDRGRRTRFNCRHTGLSECGQGTDRAVHRHGNLL